LAFKRNLEDRKIPRIKSTGGLIFFTCNLKGRDIIKSHWYYLTNPRDAAQKPAGSDSVFTEHTVMEPPSLQFCSYFPN
jgi:hypothetical protein